MWWFWNLTLLSNRSVTSALFVKQSFTRAHSYARPRTRRKKTAPDVNIVASTASTWESWCIDLLLQQTLRATENLPGVRAHRLYVLNLTACCHCVKMNRGPFGDGWVIDEEQRAEPIWWHPGSAGQSLSLFICGGWERSSNLKGHSH